MKCSKQDIKTPFEILPKLSFIDPPLCNPIHTNMHKDTNTYTKPPPAHVIQSSNAMSIAAQHWVNRPQTVCCDLCSPLCYTKAKRRGENGNGWFCTTTDAVARQR